MGLDSPCLHGYLMLLDNPVDTTQRS